MAVTTQENDQDHLERKSNKRKTRDALGEDGSRQIDDERHKKKKKEILVDQNAPESKREKKKKSNKIGDEGEASNADNISETEPIEDMNKKKKKKKKSNKIGDEGEASNADNISETEPIEDMNKKKKKKKKEDEMNGNKSEKQKKNKRIGGKEEALLVYEEAERVEVSKREKKKKAENEVNDGNREKTKKQKKNKSRDEGGVSQAEDVSKESEPMEDKKKKKKKKKAADESKAGYCVEDDRTVLVENQNEKIKSLRSKEKRKKKKDGLGVGSLDEEPISSNHVPLIRNEKRSRDRSSKMKKIAGSNTEGEGKASLKTSKRKNNIESSERSTTTSKKKKVVRFSDQVEFLSLADNSGGTEKLKDHRKGKKKVGRLEQGKVPSEENDQTEKENDGLIRGVRFSAEEDEILKSAVLNYVEKYQLGEMGVEKVMKCGKYKIKAPWKEIAKALPNRPYWSVYSRGHVLFERSENRAWTPEEIEKLKELYKRHGANWRVIGDEMGKHRFHVKDAWRRIRYTDMKKGQWSQEEYGTLFELVNKDLRLKAFQDKKSKHGMLRDNISWEAVGDKIPTRGNSLCCMKWYDKLTSSMVKEGIWADADDYRLIIALEELDAPCLDDVDWDHLLEHREGDICRMRWNQMVRHIGKHETKSFAEQVEILSKRYCPDLLEDRVAWDSKPYVDL